MKELGEKLRKLRQEDGYTLRELGQELNMSFSILAMYERGERTPPADKLILLSDFFEVSIDYLLGKIKYRNYPEDLVTDLASHNKDIQAGEKRRYLKRFIKAPVMEEEQKKYRVVNRKTIEAGKYFYLRVKDDSMVGSRIQSGDLVLVQKKAGMKNASIAVVNIGDNKIIRHIFFKSDRVILKPANSDYEPIILDKGGVEVLGRVVRVEFDL
ncbi:MAG TPA: S24 family peptidase [Halanaerobiales bacterium]|nr:S24 family peptidase [Halanaerobiales bacterium]